MIEIKKASVSDAQEILAMVRYVSDHMEQKEWYVVFLWRLFLKKI